MIAPGGFGRQAGGSCLNPFPVAPADQVKDLPAFEYLWQAGHQRTAEAARPGAATEDQQDGFFARQTEMFPCLLARLGENARFFGRKRLPECIEAGSLEQLGAQRIAGFDTLGQPLLAEKSGILAETREHAWKRFGLSDKQPVLLVFGGSTGARGLSQALMTSLPQILEGWQVLHLVGARDWDWVQASAASLPAATAGRYHPYQYLHSNEMALALAAADLALSRAGASVLGEFPLFELPAILVPYPHAWRYQKTNADVLASRGAAIRVDEETLPNELVPLLVRLLGDASERKRMAAASGAQKRPEAAARLAEELLAISHRL